MPSPSTLPPGSWMTLSRSNVSVVARLAETKLLLPQASQRPLAATRPLIQNRPERPGNRRRNLRKRRLHEEHWHVRPGSGLVSNDTYIFENETWLDLLFESSDVHPPGRYHHSMAYLGGDRVLVFGGRDAVDNWLGDTWRYGVIGGEWVEDTAQGLLPGPSPRAESAMAASVLDGCVKVIDTLYSGQSSSTFLNDTWAYGASTQPIC